MQISENSDVLGYQSRTLWFFQHGLIGEYEALGDSNSAEQLWSNQSICFKTLIQKSIANSNANCQFYIDNVSWFHQRNQMNMMETLMGP